MEISLKTLNEHVEEIAGLLDGSGQDESTLLIHSIEQCDEAQAALMVLMASMTGARLKSAMPNVRVIAKMIGVCRANAVIAADDLEADWFFNE